MGSEGVVESVDPFGVDGDGGADGGVAGDGDRPAAFVPKERVVSVLPADIVGVWGDSEFPRLAVADWGLEAFRGSVVHQLAVAERGRVPKAGMLARKVLADPKKKP